MWYFAWMLGLGFACALGIINAIWYELTDQDVDGRE
jgi:cyd operon protein YbgT